MKRIIKNKLFSLVTVILTVCLLLAACNQSDSKTDSNQTEQEKESQVVEESATAEVSNNNDEKNEEDDYEFGPQDDKKITVGQVGTGIKPAMIVLANELNYFAEEGIEMEFVQIQNLNDGITAVSQEKLDVLPMGIIPSVTYIANGADLVIYGGTISEGSEAACLPENQEKFSDINNLGDTKITCMRPETGHMFIQDYLKQNGIENVEWLELDNFQSGIEAVKKGNADLAIVNSGFGYNAEQQGLVIPFRVADYFPRNVCCRQTTNRTVFEEKRESLIRLQIANIRAYAFAYGDDQANKEEVISLLEGYSGLEPDYIDFSIYSQVMKYELDPATDKVRDFYELMLRNEQIAPDEDVDIENQMDYLVYQEALERLVARYPDQALYQELLDNIGRDNRIAN